MTVAEVLADFCTVMGLSPGTAHHCTAAPFDVTFYPPSSPPDRSLPLSLYIKGRCAVARIDTAAAAAFALARRLCAENDPPTLPVLPSPAQVRQALI